MIINLICTAVVHAGICGLPYRLGVTLIDVWPIGHGMIKSCRRITYATMTRPLLRVSGAVCS